MGWKAIYEGDPTEYEWAEKRFMKEPTEYEWAEKRFMKEIPRSMIGLKSDS